MAASHVNARTERTFVSGQPHNTCEPPHSVIKTLNTESHRLAAFAPDARRAPRSIDRGHARRDATSGQPPERVGAQAQHRAHLHLCPTHIIGSTRLIQTQ